MPDPRVVAVRACPACGLEHGAVKFWENRDANGALVGGPPYYALCPDSADSLALMPDKEGHEKVVPVG